MPAKRPTLAGSSVSFRGRKFKKITQHARFGVLEWSPQTLPQYRRKSLMKSRILVTLPLAAMLAFPAFAQTSPSSTQDQSNTPAASQPAQSTENATGKQPLQAPPRQALWRRVNPRTPKDNTQRHTAPMRE